MSKMNSTFNELKSCQNSRQNLDITSLWKNVMIVFNYEKYYKLSNSTLSLDDINLNQNEVIRDLSNFFYVKKIKFIDDYIPVAKSEQAKKLLEDAKLWIISIILYSKLDHLNKENPDKAIKDNKLEYKKKALLLNIFKSGLTAKTNPYYLFEFFLILISELNSEEFEQLKLVVKQEHFPEEFIEIYRENREKLYKIFAGKSVDDIGQINQDDTMNINKNATFTYNKDLFNNTLDENILHRNLDIKNCSRTTDKEMHYNKINDMFNVNGSVNSIDKIIDNYDNADNTGDNEDNFLKDFSVNNNVLYNKSQENDWRGCVGGGKSDLTKIHTSQPGIFSDPRNNTDNINKYFTSEDTSISNKDYLSQYMKNSEAYDFDVKNSNANQILNKNNNISNDNIQKLLKLQMTDRTGEDKSNALNDYLNIKTDHCKMREKDIGSKSTNATADNNKDINDVTIENNIELVENIKPLEEVHDYDEIDTSKIKLVNKNILNKGYFAVFKIIYSDERDKRLLSFEREKGEPFARNEFYLYNLKHGQKTHKEKKEINEIYDYIRNNTEFTNFIYVPNSNNKLKEILDRN